MQAVANFNIINFNAGCGKPQHYSISCRLWQTSTLSILMQAVANLNIIHFNTGCGKPQHYSLL
jgi:hypothetical protein